MADDTRSGRQRLAGPARRYHRPEAPRVEADPRRAPRSADGAREPGAAPRPPRACARPPRSRAGSGRPAVRRPRRLQAGQRLVRPRGRRPDPVPRSRSGSARRSGPRTSSAARAATSSRCCSTGSSTPTRRPSRRSGSWASCGGRSSWAAASIVVGGSIGIAVASERGATAEDLLIQADAAMYAAKRGRQGHVRGLRPADAGPNLDGARGGRLKRTTERSGGDGGESNSPSRTLNRNPLRACPMVCRRPAGRPSAGYRTVQSRAPRSGLTPGYATLARIAAPLNDASTTRGTEVASTLTLLLTQRRRESTGGCQVLRFAA